MDFKWEMQERIDAGMNPDEAYYETRDAYAGYSDNREKFACDCNARCVCSCTSELDCECKTPVGEAVPFGDAPHRRWRS